MRPSAKLYTLLFTLLCSQVTYSQQQPKPTGSEDDVLKINADLVQTGITVLDKQAHFVDGLRREDFELRVDGRSVPISFFENIVTGSLRDRVARPSTDQEIEAKRAAVSFRQRTIVFFLDDRHLSLDSTNRTRKMLANFLEKEMGQNDLVAIASASGRIGFLQQFTDNKDVLRAAMERIAPLNSTVTDYGSNPGAPMTEFMALTIEKKNDSDVYEFYVRDCMKWAPRIRTTSGTGGSRPNCELEVQNRARQIVMQAGTVTAATYYSLDTLLKSAERMPGSKLAFFISDGFLMDTGPRGPVGDTQLERITDRARGAGVVIYTIDARGLFSGMADATGAVPMDPNGRLESANLRGVAASQDALNALAGDTGGRALRNQNYFDGFINQALTETSRYYLIAWRPETTDVKTEAKKIEVSVIGHPELTVRTARNFFSNNPPPAPPAKEKKVASAKEQKPDADIRAALEDFYPKQTLPLQLSLIYLDTPDNGTVLTTSVQTPSEFLSYGDQDKEPAQLSIVGVVLNDQGKPAAQFKTGLKVNPASQRTGSNVIYNYPSPIKPGIYQVRVAVRDDHSKKVGSEMQWIVVPDLLKGQLLLSSLIVGLQQVSNNKNVDGQQTQWSVDRRFAPNTHMSLMTFIYNPVQRASNDLVARVNVYKDGQPVISSPAKTISAANQPDPARVPFTAELNLTGLQTGKYLLEVIVEDRTSQKSATQRSSFYIE